MKSTTYMTTKNLWLNDDGTVDDKNAFGDCKLIPTGTILTETDDSDKDTDQITICDAELADGTQILDAFSLSWITPVENCGIIKHNGKKYMLTDSASAWYDYNSNSLDPDNWFRHTALLLTDSGTVATDDDGDPITCSAWYHVANGTVDPSDIDFDNPDFIA